MHNVFGEAACSAGSVQTGDMLPLPLDGAYFLKRAGCMWHEGVYLSRTVVNVGELYRRMECNNMGNHESTMSGIHVGAS